MSKEHIIKARKLKDGTFAAVLSNGTSWSFLPDESDWAYIGAMTGDDVERG